MRRALYIFISIVALLATACQDEHIPVHTISFGDMSSEVIATDAYITFDVPRYTIDGAVVDKFNYGVEYGLNSDDMQRVAPSKVEDGVAVVIISNLMNKRDYKYRLWAEKQSGEVVYSDTYLLSVNMPIYAIEFRGTYNIYTRWNEAEIYIVKPYYTIDDEEAALADDAYVLQYRSDNGSEWREVALEEPMGENLLYFHLAELTEHTAYTYRLCVTLGDNSVAQGDTESFTTPYMHNYQIHTMGGITPYGICAYLEDKVTLTIDGTRHNIEQLHLIYNIKGSDKSTTIELDPQIGFGERGCWIPTTTDTRLEEYTEYEYRYRVVPEGDYPTIESSTHSFTTGGATVSTAIAKPEVTVADKQVAVGIASITALLDGRYGAEYDAVIECCKVGDTTWHTLVATSHDDYALYATLPLDTLDGGATYDFRCRVSVRGEAYYSEISWATLPDDTPPAPPVENGDTSALAGVWHLAEWRGTAPSFEVYMDISDNGIVDLYQRIESREWQHFISSAAYEDGIIRGTYSDGVAWGASYSVTLDADSMIWVDVNDPTDVSVYVRAELPDDIADTTRAIGTIGATKRFL